ncbi:MAG: hypothetical protein AB2404_07095 [Planifilum fimeticola]
MSAASSFFLRRILACSLILLVAALDFGGHAEAEVPPRVSKVEVYRVHSGHARPVPVTRLIHVEVERVLEGVQQMAGTSFSQMPAEYFLFRFPTPVALPDSPVGYPIREIAVTAPQSAWDPPRLLIRNGQNHWVEYRTSRPLTVLLDQLKEQGL